MNRDKALRVCLDLLGAPKYSGDDEMPPGAELDLDERMQRLLRTLKCRTCDAPATCIGEYEGHGGEQPACDDCCGHGNEDGHCERVGGSPS